MCKCQRAFRCGEESAETGVLGHVAAQLASGGRWRTSCQGYDLKHVTASTAAGQRNRFLQLQPASRTRVPLTHAMVYCSGLRVVVCCLGALGPTHPTANLYSVWTPRHLLLPLLSFQILFSLGVFGCQHRWLAPSLWIYNKINSLTASLSTSI